jgi:hypothetical protein
MKHVIFPVILAVTIPVFAQQPAAQPDSPLVAAAKRTNRLGKKPSLVITNENLVRINDGRGFTTSTAQQPVTAPKADIKPTPEMQAAAANQKARETAAAAALEKRKIQDAKSAQAAQREGHYEGEGYLDADPAQHEHSMEQLTKPAEPSQPRSSSNTSQPQQSQKPPQN